MSFAAEMRDFFSGFRATSSAAGDIRDRIDKRKNTFDFDAAKKGAPGAGTFGPGAGGSKTSSKGGSTPPAEIRKIIDANVPEDMRDYAYRMAQKESAFDPSAVSKTGATGLFQFTSGTWTDMTKQSIGAHSDGRKDPVANTQAFVKLTDRNRDYLTQVLGRDPTYGELAIAHQQGPAGAAYLITGRAPKGVDVAQIEKNLAHNNIKSKGLDAAKHIAGYYGFDLGDMSKVASGAIPDVPTASYTPPQVDDGSVVAGDYEYKRDISQYGDDNSDDGSYQSDDLLEGSRNAAIDISAIDIPEGAKLYAPGDLTENRPIYAAEGMSVPWANEVSRVVRPTNNLSVYRPKQTTGAVADVPDVAEDKKKKPKKPTVEDLLNSTKRLKPGEQQKVTPRDTGTPGTKNYVQRSPKANLGTPGTKNYVQRSATAPTGTPGTKNYVQRATVPVVNAGKGNGIDVGNNIGIKRNIKRKKKDETALSPDTPAVDTPVDTDDGEDTAPAAQSAPAPAAASMMKRRAIPTSPIASMPAPAPTSPIASMPAPAPGAPVAMPRPAAPTLAPKPLTLPNAGMKPAGFANTIKKPVQKNLFANIGKPKMFAEGGPVDAEDDEAVPGTVTPASYRQQSLSQPVPGANRDVLAMEERPRPASSGVSIGNAIDLGLKHLTRSLGLDRENAAVGPDPDYRNKQRKLVNGAIAPNEGPPNGEEVQQIFQTVDPNGELDDGLRTIYAMKKGVEFYLQRGDVDKAGKFAAGLIQYSNLMSRRFGYEAVQAGKNGDVDGMVKYAIKAYDAVPDGLNANVEPAEGGYQVTRTNEDGEVVDQHMLTPQQIFQMATGISSGSGYFEALMEVAEPGTSASARKEKQAKARAGNLDKLLPDIKGDMDPGEIEAWSSAVEDGDYDTLNKILGNVQTRRREAAKEKAQTERDALIDRRIEEGRRATEANLDKRIEASEGRQQRAIDDRDRRDQERRDAESSKEEQKRQRRVTTLNKLRSTYEPLMTQGQKDAWDAAVEENDPDTLRDIISGINGANGGAPVAEPPAPPEEPGVVSRAWDSVFGGDDAGAGNANAAIPPQVTPQSNSAGKPIPPDVLAKAKAAIAEGRSRAGVIKKLQDAGYSTEGL